MRSQWIGGILLFLSSACAIAPAHSQQGAIVAPPQTDSSHIDPESLGCLGVRALVDADTEDQVVSVDTGGLKEPKVEPDQSGVAVYEDNSIGMAVGLGLCALAPVSDRPGDQ